MSEQPESIKEEIKDPIKPAPFPFTKEIASETQIKRTKKAAAELGMKEKEPELTSGQKIIRTSLLSFLIMAILTWVAWLKMSVVGNSWIGTWEQFFTNLYTTAVMFTQVFLAKVKQYYDNKKSD